MTRTRLLVALFAVALTSYRGTAQSITSGFQSTVNHYAVGMNPDNDCRHPSDGKPKCSQHFNFHFQANTDGTINAPFELTNDSARGFCGRVHIIARDRPGNPPGRVLLDVKSGLYCIKGKGPDTGFHERVGHVDWTFQADPQVGLNGHDLYMVGEEYEDTGLDLGWLNVLAKAIEVIGVVAKLAPALL
jgi:hypothetical protein